ncbi:MAG TPA: T9SS type A sorting domain-containing protein [Puia sp.]|nr:T9SS type A sorting domain-containing protein [Puia sp.]
MKAAIFYLLRTGGYRLFAGVAPMFFTFCSHAATITARATGNWETRSTWSGNVVPRATDIVVIPAGFTVTVSATGDVCGPLTINAGGTLTINKNDALSIGGSFTNAGSFTASTGSTLTFNGGTTTVISGGGTYLIAGVIVLDMGSSTTVLDVQDANFGTGITNGGKDYFSLIQGTLKMDNAGTLYMYDNGSANSLTIPYGVTIESDAGELHLADRGTGNNVILSGKLFVNGGSVDVQTGQSLNAAQDFKYTVNGGTPQLYISSGTLNIGAGFNALNSSDYIDFEMTGGTIILAYNGYSNWITFQLADNLGGKTLMSAGLIILQNACNNNIEDIDMGGANVAATLYSVTGGTVQFGYSATQATSTYFGIDGQPATNYPHLDFEPGTAKDAASFNGQSVNMLSLHINSNQTFDATRFPVVNIMSNNGDYAFDQEGTFTQGSNTVEFSGAVPQKISSSSLGGLSFYNLEIANTAGNVNLAIPVTVTNQLSFTSGKIDATANSLTLTNGSAAVSGSSASSYVIAGNGVSPATGQLIIDNIPANTGTSFPIGTSSYYLPATINPGANSGTSYSTFVFQGATSNAQANGPAFTAPFLAQMVNAVWNVNQTTGSGTAALTLNWLASGTALEGSDFQSAGTNIGISRYTGAGGGWAAPTGSGDVATKTAVSSFSNWTQYIVNKNDVILSTSLVDFRAALNDDNTVSVSWETAHETGLTKYLVQRAAGGGDWKSIGMVPARNDAGGDARYSLVDEHPRVGVDHYRLQIQEADGTYFYSAVKAIELRSGIGMTVYPNPATDEIRIDAGGGNDVEKVLLLDAGGKALKQINGSGNTVITVPVRAYPDGMYFLQTISADGTSNISTFMIRH